MSTDAGAAKPPAGASAGRRPLVAGNWKMNLNHLEAIALTQKIAFSLDERQLSTVDVVVLPPFVDLRSVQTLVDGDRLLLGFGAQDLSPHDAGAYTGDISGAMLAKLGCSYVVVGHSERREHHHEDDAVVNAKLRAAIRHGLTPILCVGETLAVREADDQLAHCTDQVYGALEAVAPEDLSSLVVAYEPVWAIGTGKVATAGDAQQVCASLRAALVDRVGTQRADAIRIVYGGSVKASNAAELLAEPDIDGALVGGASLDAADFAAICATAAEQAAGILSAQ